MKKIFLVLCILISSFAKASEPPFDEGMWLPALIGKNYEQMKAQGFKLTAKDIYDVNNASLKDAIVWFGGFCTGEIVSSQGMVFTNHHCGYDAIAEKSTPEDNILDNGFWAKDHAAEKPIEGLWVQILVRMEDVSEQILPQVAGLAEKERAAKVNSLTSEIVKKATDGTRFVGRVSEFAKGNAYYLFIFEKFDDIRLVGTPPQSIGKYGGDTDNWVWPRHTGDFSVFRIYANKENQAAAYSPDNVPFKPKKHLPVSLKGIKEGDFSMVFGFPGRTNRYESSMGIKLAQDQTNMAIVKNRAIRLESWKEDMDKDLAVKLKLASEYANIANYWKYFIGQTEQLKRLKVYEQKLELEKGFKAWAKDKPKYSNLFPEWEKAYTAYEPYAVQQMYLSQGISGSSLFRNYSVMRSLIKQINDSNKEEMKEKALKSVEPNFEFIALPSDKKIFIRTLSAYYNDIPKDQQPEYLKSLVFGYDSPEKAFEAYADEVYDKSILSSKTRFEKFFENANPNVWEADPANKLYSALLDNYNAKYAPIIAEFRDKDKEFARLYLEGLSEYNPKLTAYFDANSTMRLTSGTVQAYDPRDAVHYDYTTTIDGVMQKYVPGDSEFDLPAKFIELYNARDYGRYADKDGNLIVGFITNNDITGGNSGSPVLNANGELIGIAFDGNWEAMSGDIVFDKKFKRCINVDIRYVLWCIEKLGGSNIVNELTLK